MDIFDINSIGIGGIAVLFILDRFGLLDKVLPIKKNGNTNGHNGDTEKILADMKHLREHYNDELSVHLKNLNERFDEHMQIERENAFYLREIIKKLDK